MNKMITLLLVAAGLHAMTVFAAAAPAAPNADAAKPRPESSKTRAAGKAAKSDSLKTTTTGFSFLMEPAPAWVLPITADPAAVAQGSAALQYGLIDEQINLEGKSSHYEHVERRIVGTAGLGHGAQIQAVFDPSYQELVLHKIEVIRDGKRIDKLDPKRVQLLQRETQLEARMYDGRITASMVLDDVRVGDRVEFAYTVRGSNPVFDGKFAYIDILGSQNGPVALHQLRVLYPENRTLQYRVPKAVQVESHKLGGKQELVLSQKMVPQQEFEAGAPASAYIGDMVQLSEFAGWNDVARWGAGLFAGVANAPAPRIARQVSAWKAATPDQAQQLQLALDFVQKEVRYFGTEIGVNSHKPNQPDKVLEQRFGDCKDKAALLIALLKALDIEAKPVLVSIAYKDKADTMLPSPLAFNHAIAQIRFDGKTTWIDGTRDQQTGPIAERQVLDYGKVLLAQDDSRELLALPDGSKEVFQTVEDRLQIQHMNADPVLVSTITWHGIMAESMRAWLASTPMTEVQTHMAKPYLRPFPKMTVNAPLRVEEIKGQNALRVIQEFNLAEFWKMTTNEKVKAETMLWSLEQELEHPRDVARKTPLHIKFPGIFRHSISAEFSEDLLDVAKDEKWSDGQSNFSININYKTTARKMSIDAELRFTGSTVAVGQWRSFTEKAKQIRPRLFPEFQAHVLDKTQVAELDKDVQAMFKTPGWVKASREERVRMAMVLYANNVLVSNRLAPGMAAKFLFVRGSALLGLAFYDKSADDFAEALKIVNDENPDYLIAAGMNQLYLQHDAAAREYAQKALKLAPHSPFVNQLQLMIAYESADYKAAKTILNDELSNETDESFAHLALIRYLVARGNGEDGTAELKAQMEKTDAKSWVYPVMQVFLSDDDVEKAAKKLAPSIKVDGAMKSAAYFYFAEKARLDGQTDTARAFFKNAMVSYRADLYTYALAKRHLAQLPPG